MGGKAWVLFIALIIVSFTASCGKSGKVAISASQSTMKLTFESTRDGNFDIYSINDDGTHPVRLTQSTGWSRFPAWSPDGKLIAFSTNRDAHARFQIYVVVPQDSVGRFGIDATPITTTGAASWHLSWSPDSKNMVCQSMRDGHFDIWVVPADTTIAAYRLTKGPDIEDEPAWSPDGKKIAYVLVDMNEKKSGIWQMNADGSQPTRVTPEEVYAYAPSWSPDSAKLVFMKGMPPDTQIAVINADGSNIQQLTKDSNNRSHPAWSPDGKKIAFGMYYGDTKNDRDIFTMNVDGTNLVNITNSPGLDDNPSWSPVLKKAQ